MNFKEYKSLIQQVRLGKSLPTAIYLHKSALEEALPSTLYKHLKATAFTTSYISWNILKLFKRDFRVTLLYYPDFDTYAYPELKTSCLIDLLDSSYKISNYSNSENPPILHRKETFILTSHPQHAEFCDITHEGETLGLYQNTRTIGFKKQWRKLIKQSGHQLDENGRLHPIPLPVEETPSQNPGKIKRHLTAINRDRLSAPFQKLAKHGYLTGHHSILDYGCGLGDDLRELEAHGLNVNGWDPVHLPSGAKKKSDIVNLGFVLNVIEDQQERSETLKQAYSFTEKLLVVSVMLTNETKLEQFKPYKDGVITKRQTFQKYYSQSQIREYIESTLNIKTIALGQGVIGVFKDKTLEEAHHLELQYLSHDWQHLTKRPEPRTISQAEKQSKYTKHQSLFDDFWLHCLHFGRIPANDEFELSSEIRRVTGSHNKAFELVASQFDLNEYALVQEKRKEDILVYFALSLFGKRQAKSHMPARLKRDLKAHFKSYTQCIESAEKLLFSVSNIMVIGNACYLAFEKIGLGQLNDNHSFIIPSTYLNQLPPVLRVYVGCAVQLYGDIDDIELIKIHMRSGKVTFLKFDDFDKSLPLLTERIKVRLHDLDIDYFYYGDEYPLQPLYNKVDFLAPESTEPKAQRRFDEKLAGMLKGVPKDEWPDWNILQKVFEYWGVKLAGNKFIKLKIQSDQ